MGTWGIEAFENDCACDWADDLGEVDDLSLVERAIDTAAETQRYLEFDAGVEAVAACEVLACLLGKRGKPDSYDDGILAWVRGHPTQPSADLLGRAGRALDKVLSDQSELNELWVESDLSADWLASVADLRRRMSSAP